MKKFLQALAAAGVLMLAGLLSTQAFADNSICPTRAPGDSTNACASTAFVQTAIGGSGHNPGGSNGQIQYNNNGAFGGFTPGGDLTFSNPNFTINNGAVSNAKINPGAANTMKGSLNGTATGDIPLIACSAIYQFTQWVTGTGWQCGITPVLPSRATAATINLSAYSAITTQGYTTPGDGGGATFVNVGSSPFRDSYVTGGTISAAGSGYTNGTYNDVDLTGSSTGSGLKANITIAGGVVSSVTIVENGGNGFKIGDVLTTGSGNIGGTGSGFAWTVSSVSTPQASFTDSAGTHWQYEVDSGNFINARQFGCKANWNGVDASATNDFTCLDAAIRFAAFRTSGSRIDQGGTWGAAVDLPRGTSLVCGALIVQQSVEIRGQGKYNSAWHLCDSGVSGSSHFVTLGDPNTQLSCFGAKLEDMTLSATTAAPANNSISMIFSNCIQQSEIIAHVQVLAGFRDCFLYTNGYGGAEKYIVNDFQCEMFPGTGNDGIVLKPGTTVNQIFNGLVVEAGGAGYSGDAVNWQSGNMFVNGFHEEGIATGFNAQVPTSTYQGSIHAADGGTGCTQLILLQSTNTPGNLVVGTSQKNGCTTLVTNGQTGGSNQTFDQVLDKVFNP